MPMKPEELYTAMILSAIVIIFVVPTIILALFHAGPVEYFVAISLFFIFGIIFWNAGAVLRQD